MVYWGGRVLCCELGIKFRDHVLNIFRGVVGLLMCVYVNRVQIESVVKGFRYSEV